MKVYPHILARLNRTIWGATPETVEAIRDVLEAAMLGRVEMDIDPATAIVARSAAMVAMFGDGKEAETPPYVVNGETAIVPVFGVIGKHLNALETMCGGLDLDQLAQAVTLAHADPNIEQLVLWFHTPGGVVTGTPEVAGLIRKLSESKPIYAYTDGLMCSCGYWLGSACTNLFAAPSARVGNVGVFLSWLDRTEQAAKEGIKLQLIKAGKFKAAPHPLAELEPEVAEHLQADINATAARFKADIALRRAIEPEHLEAQAYSWDSQLSTGLVDAHVDSIGELLADLAGAR